MAQKPIGFLPFIEDEDDNHSSSNEKIVKTVKSFMNSYEPADDIRSAHQLMSLQEIADSAGTKPTASLAAQLSICGFKFYQASTTKMYFINRK